MKEALIRVAEARNGQRWLDIYNILEREMFATTGIKPNLDFPTGPAYYLMGFDIPSFTPLFVMSRITGWTAHIIEQAGSNALIRPLSEYSGQPQRSLSAATAGR
jgi:citrate synthase